MRGGGVDLVFLDYHMPGLNGAETFTELKREFPAVDVVMMTSMEDGVVADRARAAGAAFLKKPFYPADIDALLGKFYGFGAFKWSA